MTKIKLCISKLSGHDDTDDDTDIGDNNNTIRCDDG